ncbi:uncharacterized protein LOC135201135 [Macrobrachium nipponense]|uniref:uncharacterized protein LOC135201135 n=1 Tax=Macrobrachium nipponense TaxID=159736 RepID=UPI0030C865A6
MKTFASLISVSYLLCESLLRILVRVLFSDTYRVRLYDPMSLLAAHGAEKGTVRRRGRPCPQSRDKAQQPSSNPQLRRNPLGGARRHRQTRPRRGILEPLRRKAQDPRRDHQEEDARNCASSSSSDGGGEKVHFMALGFLALLVLLPNAIIAYELKPMTTTSQMTLAGEKAKLPCKIPLPPGDRPLLILWYKDQVTKPFYSYDARETAAGRHKIHDNSDLATRSRFTLETFPNKFKLHIGFLEVEEVNLRDTGNFTCRVDFQTSRTLMALVKLTVHEEIRGLEVFDSDGTMVSKVVGPYEQATRITLSCRAYGGYPSPVVQWRSGDVVLESSTDLSYSGPKVTLTSNHRDNEPPLASAHVSLHLPGLQREDDGREITCMAFNTNLTQPRSRVLTLEVYLPPLEVKLEGLEKPLMAGIESLIQCRSTGSKPPAKLLWKIQGNNVLSPYPAQFSLNRNTTTQRVRFLPTPDDNGRALTCTASNPKVPHYHLATSRTLQVYFAPEVKARLAPALDPEKIKEGEDVYFECVIKANPPETRVLWLHQGVELQTDLTRGVLAQGKNLVLQKVSRHARGKYQCRVTNGINTVTSGPAHLNVMFAPECKEPRNTTVSVTPSEEVKLNCVVESNPEEVEFVWKVNSSRGMTELDPSTYTSRGRTSTIVYRPSAHAIANDQYGVVFCQGINKLGVQKVPCMFVISPAGPPEEPISCALRNQSATSLTVICQPGHDGGLKQHFVVTIQNAETQEVVANVTSEEPIFSVGGLAPGRDYLVMVKAVNSKGSSRPYVLEGFALKVAENKINNSSSVESSPLLAMFVGVVSGFVFILTVLAAANRARGRRRQGQNDSPSNSNKYSNGDEGKKLDKLLCRLPPTPPWMWAGKENANGNNEEEDDEEGDAEVTESQTGSLLTVKTVTVQRTGSSGSLTSRTYVPGPPGHTGSLPRSYMNPKPQPLHSVDLPHVTSNNHKYYTLKINCTRQNNESFV